MSKGGLHSLLYDFQLDSKAAGSICCNERCDFWCNATKVLMLPAELCVVMKERTLSGSFPFGGLLPCISRQSRLSGTTVRPVSATMIDSRNPACTSSLANVSRLMSSNVLTIAATSHPRSACKHVDRVGGGVCCPLPRHKAINLIRSESESECGDRQAAGQRIDLRQAHLRYFFQRGIREPCDQVTCRSILGGLASKKQEVPIHRNKVFHNAFPKVTLGSVRHKLQNSAYTHVF